MSNRIRRHQEKQYKEESGHKLWVKIVFIIIILMFILGMIMLGF